MPTYIYKNLTTDEVFEVQQRMSEDALTVHPETGDPVKKLVSAPAIAFKGSGFYANDSRASKGAGKAKSEDSSANSGSNSDASSNSDSGSKSDSSKSDSSKSDSGKSESKSSESAASSTPAPSSAPSPAAQPAASSKTG